MNISEELGLNVYSSYKVIPWKSHTKFLKENGLRALLTPDGIQPTDVEWALDNGAFTAWLRNKPFNELKFEKAVKRAQRYSRRPDFGVIPDIVAGGLRSLDYSEKWMSKLDSEWPWYLAVQDGMSQEDVHGFREDVQGIFVGGTLNWKLRTGEEWVKFAHRNNLKCHIGRCGVRNRIIWAIRIGAESIDSGSWMRNESIEPLLQAIHQGGLSSWAPPSGGKISDTEGT